MSTSHVSFPLLGGSEERLWSLSAERSDSGADTAAIDRRIWDLFGETWAVMYTDLSGFSRSVEAFGIIHFLQIILEQKRILLPIVAQHDGILVKAEADSFLILFRRPERALSCAVEMQRACERHNRRRAPEEQVLLCVGIGYGEVLRIGDTDVFGREVNAASKLGEDTAKSYEILLTRAAREACGDPEEIRFEDLGMGVGGSPENFKVSYSPAG
ncbi:MAG TPA: adenylate/guanylate cyclase domain-containing protein [Arenimonas sp.]|nr:adenylate/guanylate cyclase domain-containing protein [Arenimonas sp.]